MTHSIVQPTSLFDAHSIDQLRLEISYLLDTGTKSILLDCREIESINSLSLGVLVAILKQAKKQGAEIILCELNLQVQRIIKLAHLDEIFRIYSNHHEFEQTFALV